MKYLRTFLFGILMSATLVGLLAFLGTRAERAWIKETISYLKLFDPETAELKYYTTKDYDSEKDEFSLERDVPFQMYTSDGEMHVFKDGNWIYVVIHTLHDDDDAFEFSWGATSVSFNNIGDKVLAIDNTGSIHSTDAHFCEGRMAPQFDLNSNLKQASHLDQFMKWTGADWKKMN